MTGSWEAARPVSVLVVEDDEQDLMLIERAFRRANIPVYVRAVRDGGEAQGIIDRGQETDNRLPDLIFLDLNLPTVDGRDILKSMRSQDTLSSIPIVVLTGVLDENAVAYSETYDDVLYFEKPGDLETMTHIVNQAVRALTSGSSRLSA